MFSAIVMESGLGLPRPRYSSKSGRIRSASVMSEPVLFLFEIVGRPRKRIVSSSN